MGGGAAAMAWGCALCLALAGGALLALLVQLLRWLRADGDLTLLWAERWGKKPGNAALQQPRQGTAVAPGAGAGRSANGVARSTAVLVAPAVPWGYP